MEERTKWRKRRNQERITPIAQRVQMQGHDMATMVNNHKPQSARPPTKLNTMKARQCIIAGEPLTNTQTERPTTTASLHVVRQISDAQEETSRTKTMQDPHANATTTSATMPIETMPTVHALHNGRPLTADAILHPQRLNHANANQKERCA